ncbi:hypothetical protein M405DRAFT_819939 [Rhizopogon salebrosus TDB-379]|nr:hypothetical protein M405DRAFT_819939 [Rhizopogon salebrosus TDB-379]
MAPVAMYSSTVRDPRTSMFTPFLLVELRTTNLEPSSITTIHPLHPIRDSRVKRYISADHSIDRGGL